MTANEDRSATTVDADAGLTVAHGACHPAAPNAREASDDRISLLDLMVVLAKHVKLIAILPAIVFIVSFIYAVQLPDIYTATTKILPPQQNQSGISGVVAQLGGLAGLAGGAVKNPSDVYIAMLHSRTIADRLVDEFKLIDTFHFNYRSQARQWLHAHAKVASGREGIISIEFDDEDKHRAAAIANAFVDELLKFTRVLAVTEASRRRLFFERQLAQAKENLTKAEAAARHGLEQRGLVKVDDQGRAMVETSARLRGQIAVKEVEIGAMRAFAANHNPELQRAQEELLSMKRELAKMEGAPGRAASTAGNSDGGMDTLSLLRNVKYYETIYELLARQFELAKIDEATDSAVVQVMDRAVEPEIKSKPNRRNIILISTLIALVVGVVAAFAREAIARTVNDPEQLARLRLARRQLRW